MLISSGMIKVEMDMEVKDNGQMELPMVMYNNHGQQECLIILSGQLIQNKVASDITSKFNMNKNYFYAPVLRGGWGIEICPCTSN